MLPTSTSTNLVLIWSISQEWERYAASGKLRGKLRPREKQCTAGFHRVKSLSKGSIRVQGSVILPASLEVVLVFGGCTGPWRIVHSWTLWWSFGKCDGFEECSGPLADIMVPWRIY